MIQLDGNYLEGGGSIARVALAFSTLFQKSFEIDNIRANRPQPGLKNQHLFCIKALEKLCNAKTDNATLGSTKLHYVPGKIQGQTIDIDIQTAGSIPLFTQAIILPSLFANKKTTFNVIGGTDTQWAAPIDYLKEILLPQLQKFADIECILSKRGYFPKGQGNVSLTIKPKFSINNFNSFNEFSGELSKSIPKIFLKKQGDLVQIKGISHASTDLQEAQVAERQAKAAEAELSKLECRVNIQHAYSNTPSTGSGITLWAIFARQEEINSNNPVRLGASALGKRGKPADQVGIVAAKNLIEEIESEAACDQHLADQLIKYMALLPGSQIKTSKITDHTKTNIYTVEQFTGKLFEIDEKNNTISVKEM